MTQQDQVGIIRQLTENGVNINILGYIVFWNVRDVDINKDIYANVLEHCNIDTKYAREHNYRSAFIRALKSLEEQRIIRKVEENSDRLVYQFTAEVKVSDDPDNPHFLYNMESIVEIDKDAYYTFQDFERAITKCDEAAKPVIVELFNKEKVRYRSSDITRYTQNIISDMADIISLRPQGSVYFVPAIYKPVVDKVHQMMDMIQSHGGTAVLEHIPIPDVLAGRSMVYNALISELNVVYEKLYNEVNAATDAEKGVSERWVGHRVQQLDVIKHRIDMYSVVATDNLETLNNKFNDLRALADTITINN